MGTMKPPALRFLPAFAALIVGILIASQATAAELAAADPSGRLAILPSILSFHRGDYSESGPEIKLFEAGGGDPAMNGSFVYISIEYLSKSYVWETGLNIRSITGISFHPGNSIRVEATEDVMDKNHSIINRKASYRFRFHIEDGVLQDKLSMDKL